MGEELVVTLDVWRLPQRQAPAALWRMARDRGRLRRTPGVRFAKLLGTGRDRTFSPGQLDPTRWAALTVWADAQAAAAPNPVSAAWRSLAVARCRLVLRPLASRGVWAGQQPFVPARSGQGRRGHAEDPVGPVLVLTRARLRPHLALRFWRAIPPIAAAASVAPGLLAAWAIGEAPVGWQGTVSVWAAPACLVEFAYRHPEHRRVIERTRTTDWYAEELFARFAVLDVTGDREVIGWVERTPLG